MASAYQSLKTRWAGTLARRSSASSCPGGYVGVVGEGVAQVGGYGRLPGHELVLSVWGEAFHQDMSRWALGLASSSWTS